MSAIAVAHSASQNHFLQTLHLARQRKRFIVNRRMQNLLAVQYFIFALLGGLLGYANVHVLTTLSEANGGSIWVFDPQSWENFALIWLYLLMSIAVSLAFLFGVCMIFSHRIAGPADKISAALEQIADGDLNLKITLRKADLLKETATSFNAAALHWRLVIRELEKSVMELGYVSNDPKVRMRVGHMQRMLEKAQAVE